MAYINFKEETYVAKKQLTNRRENNDKNLKDIEKDKTILKNYSPYQDYSYKIHKEESFGKVGLEDEENFIVLKDKDIVCAKFINCRFSNIKFEKCNFIGCIFENCEFLGGGVSFDNCSFIKTDSYKKPSLNVNDNFSCYFKGCKIYPKFFNCDLSFAVFQECLIKNSYFKLNDMTSVIIYLSELDTITIEDSNLSGIKVLKTYIKDLDFTDKQKSKLDEKSFFDKIKPRQETKDEYEGIYMTYQTIADKFKDNSLKNNFGEYYFLAKKTQRKTLDLGPKIMSYLYYFTCGYGERPEYALLFSLFVMVSFGFIYLFTGVIIEEVPIGILEGTLSNVSFREFLTYYNDTLNLSVSMFSGVGFVNSKPNTISYNIANIEMIIGILMMGVGIGTLTRKIVR